MSFLTRLVLEVLDENRWRLASPLVYRTRRGDLIRVPEGFVTDLASVPRVPLVWELCGACGNRAAVVHDWLYHIADRSRAEADRIFREALLDEGEPAWRAWTMWLGVRLFGGPFWARKRPEGGGRDAEEI